MVPATSGPQDTTAVSAVTRNPIYLNGVIGAPLAGRMEGRLYALNGRTLSGFVQEDSGEFVAAHPSLRSLTADLLYRTPEGSVVAASYQSEIYVIDADLSRVLRKIAHEPGVDILGLDRSGRVWRPFNGRPSLSLHGFGTADNSTSYVDVPPGLRPLGVVDDLIILAGGGRTWRQDPSTGQVSPYADGEAIVAGNGWVVWQSCSLSLECVWHVGNETNASVTQRPACGLESPFLPTDISPDGKALILGGDTLYDLSGFNRQKTIEGGYHGRWSADSRWYVIGNSAFDRFNGWEVQSLRLPEYGGYSPTFVLL